MNEKITLQDLINLFCEKQNMNKKDAELFVRSLFELIEEALTTEKYVKVKGFGTFKLTEVDSRESINVNTGERIEIQGHTKISFTPDPTLKELINKPFSHFETVMLNDGVEFEDTPVETSESMIQDEVVPTSQVVEETPIIEESEPDSIIETALGVIEESTIEASITGETKEEAIEVPTTTAPTIESTVEEPVEAVTTVELHQEAIESEEEIQEKPTSIEGKSTNRILWGIIVILILIIFFGAYWMFLRPSATPEVTPTQPVQKEVTISEPVTEEKIQEDTLKIVQFIELSEGELRKERVPSLTDTVDYRIVGTQTEYTLQNGETIIRASVRFFGTKKYWPYIVKHNMDILKDPDNIPAGIRIKIPKLVEKK